MMMESLVTRTKQLLASAGTHIRQKYSERLNGDEIILYKNFVKVSKLEQFSKDFPNVKSIPNHIRFFNDQKIRDFISSDALRERLPFLLEEHKRLEGEEQKKREEIARKAEEEEKNKSYFSFWSYRGIVYGASKYQKREGDYIKPVTEFFLQIRGRSDEHFKLVGYDLSIANGQDVCMICACKRGKTSGNFVQYINMNMNSATMLTDSKSRVIRETFGFMAGDNGRFDFELKRYKSRL